MLAGMRTLINNLEFVLTVDEKNSVLRDAAVVVEDDRIADVGPAAELTRRHPEGSFGAVIDGSRYGMIPGLIDSHVHLGETLSRAVFPDVVTTHAWVFHWGKPFYAHTDARDEQVGSLVSMAEMLRCGTTCFLDMGAHNDVAGVVSGMEQTGIRGITGRHACDVRPSVPPAGWTEEMVAHHYFPNAREALRALEQTVKDFNGAAEGRARMWVNIEGKEPDSSLELHIKARSLAEKLGVGTTYHLATTDNETRSSQKKYGMSPVKRIAVNDGLGPNLVIAHCVAVTDEDVALMAKAGTGAAFCPACSLKLGKGATKIGKYLEMLSAGVRLGLGTDGVSAGGNLSMMRQMYLMAGLFKDARLDATAVGAAKALRIATIEGARLLGWDDDIGSIERGKKADFVLFDLDHFEWVPYGDPLQAVVYSASPASIAQTWVDGRALYRDGKVQTLDEKGLRAEARERAAQIVKRAGLSRERTPTVSSVYA
jgi:cytosine/adenosine deaminase-related metal-dependent hydrolase